MSQRKLIGKLLLAPALVLLVLLVVAAGQIITSRDLLGAVRSIDGLQIALRVNGEAAERRHEAGEALQAYLAVQPGKEGDAALAAAKDRLLHGIDRLLGIAAEMRPAGNFADEIRTDKELIGNYAGLLKQLSESLDAPSLVRDAARTGALVERRLKERDQAFHAALAERSSVARAEAEAAIPIVVLLTVIGAMAALAGSLVTTQGLATSLGRLAEAMRKLARGEADAGSATASLGNEFSDIAEALELFQRAALEKRAALAALAESEEGLKRVLDAAPSPLALTRPAEGKLVYANRHCRELFKVDMPTEGMDVKQFYANPADRERFVEQIRLRGELHDFEVTMRRADGADRLLLVSAVPLNYRGETVIVLGYKDITESRAMVEQLKESEEKLRVIVETTPVPLVLTRLSDDTLLYVNKLTLELFRIPEGVQVVGQPASDFWADPSGRERMKAALFEGQGHLGNFETRLKRPDGTWFWARLSAASTLFQGEDVLLVAVEDITRRRELEDELRLHATTDFLTGIANRRHFIDLAEREFSRARRYGHALSVLMLDVDRFKRINDSFGHPVGDEVVKAVAATCRQALREIDHLGRMGGEEFAILLPETSREMAAQVAERVREAVDSASVTVDGLAEPLRFTASIGLACLNAEVTAFDQMLMQADRALYKAKQAGRNCVRMAE
jgi:diguanylate cyclase (GGDEF)-like protein/PAS domain S-box-containing protein